MKTKENYKAQAIAAKILIQLTVANISTDKFLEMMAMDMEMFIGNHDWTIDEICKAEEILKTDLVIVPMEKEVDIEQLRLQCLSIAAPLCPGAEGEIEKAEEYVQYVLKGIVIKTH